MYEGMTRADIESLSNVRPYCFETVGEETWYNVGLVDGLGAADSEPDVSSLWHDKDEKPKKLPSVLATLDFMGEINTLRCEDESELRYAVSHCCVQRWAYLSDLLPNDMEVKL